MKKRIVVYLSVLLTISLLLSTLFAFSANFSSLDIDYEADERLFASASTSSTATYYYVDKNGKECEYYKDSLGAAKTWVDIEDVSEVLKRGFIAVEDRQFLKHRGVNIKRSLLALVNSVIHYTGDFGASTITQQVIKNISGDNERTLKRKLQEVLRAANIEKNHSKDEILEMYLNVVPMPRNIFGICEGARSLFNKSPSELSAAESATLIGIANAPGRYDPWNNPEECRKKRDKVLFVLKDQGILGDKEYEMAVAEELTVKPRVVTDGGIAPWFVETARGDIIKDISDKYGLSTPAAKLLLNNGTRVILTVDKDVQDVLSSYFEDLSNFPMDSDLSYAMTIFDSQTGDLAAIVGDNGCKRANRITNNALVLHPPASTLKPIAIYAPLIDKGEITWSTQLEDKPSRVFKNGDDVRYYPRNSPDSYEGRMTVAEALARSKNTVAVNLYDMLGSQTVLHNLSNGYGIDTLAKEDNDLAPLALGQLTNGISLRDLTRCYTSFPKKGLLGKGRSYFGVFSNEGEILLDNSNVDHRVMSASSAEVMCHLLAEVVRNGTARGLTLADSIDTAAKTGTSGGARNKLLVGFTPYYTAGIWCGYDDKREILSVSPSHIRIWDEVMKRVHSEALSRTKDEGLRSFDDSDVVSLLYCRETGELAVEGCKNEGCVELGYYVPGTEPKGHCQLHSE